MVISRWELLGLSSCSSLVDSWGSGRWFCILMSAFPAPPWPICWFIFLHNRSPVVMTKIWSPGWLGNFKSRKTLWCSRCLGVNLPPCMAAARCIIQYLNKWWEAAWNKWTIYIMELLSWFYLPGIYRRCHKDPKKVQLAVDLCYRKVYVATPWSNIKRQHQAVKLPEH